MVRLVSSLRLAAAISIVTFSALASAASAATLTMQASANPVSLGEELIITFAPKLTAQGDQVTFGFGEGTPPVTVSFTPACGIFGGCGTVTHTYSRLGSFTINASGTIGGTEVEGSLSILVAAGDDRFVLAAAHATGINQTVWRSDVEIHNAGVGVATVEIALLERQKDNSNPAEREVEIMAGRSLRLSDILASQFSASGTAALRITPAGGAVLVTSRTYNQGAAGTYGQYVPAAALQEAVPAGESARLIQLSHNPTLTSGFRTNIGLLNPAPTAIEVEITFFDGDGTNLGSTDVELQPFEYNQIDKAFELVTSSVIDDGYVKIRCTTPYAVFFCYASVVDNLTGDPTLIPALIP